MHRYTQSADVWAFGIIVLELASGHVPRKGMGFRSLVMQTVHGEVPTLADAGTKRAYSKVALWRSVCIWLRCVIQYTC